MIRTAAILPAYNEEIAIGSIILRTKKYVNDVIVVDDGSNDKTSEIAVIAGAHVIEHPYNMGKGAALKTGFNAVNGHDIVVTLDADGQHDPDDIPKLIRPIVNGEADMVNGSRYVNGNGKNTPSYRRIGQKVLDRATSLNGDIEVTDSQSGFRAFARHTLPAFRFKSTDFSIESEMIMDMAINGFKMKEVEIGVRYDVDGSTQNPISHGFGVLLSIMMNMRFQRVNGKKKD